MDNRKGNTVITRQDTYSKMSLNAMMQEGFAAGVRDTKSGILEFLFPSKELRDAVLR